MVVFAGDARWRVGGHGSLDPDRIDGTETIANGDGVFHDLSARRTDAVLDIGFFARRSGAILSWDAGRCRPLLVLGTVWAFLAAKKRALISPPTLVAAASLSGLLCRAAAVYGMSHPEEGLLTYVSVAGILALAVSPMATAPLALALEPKPIEGSANAERSRAECSQH